MINYLIKLAEKGKIPDFLIRLGIRNLNQKRLNQFRKLNLEDAEAVHQEWIDNLHDSPIALVPEVANEQHYEVPADFFELVLGENLKYSSGYWPNNSYSLDSSEEFMLNLTVERAGLKDGMKILELGCGWGSLTCFMAKMYPNSDIVAVSNSKDQKDFILKRCKQKNIKNIKVITADMNDFKIETTFDRIVSIEMFEHMRNYKKLFKRISSFLNDEGKIFIHIFTHKEFAYPFEDKSASDWMAREFFSGGQMPSHRLLLHFQHDVKIEKIWKVSGMHYSRTSRAWLNKMDSNKTQILDIFNKTYGLDNAKMWFQRWRIFFMACEELFGMYNGNEWLVSHYLFEKNIKSS